MSLLLDDPEFSSSTPIKKEQHLFEQSVEDLLQVIDNNISSASLNDNNGNSSSFNSQDEVDDISPIKPLNLKQQVQQQAQSLNTILATQEEENTDLLEKVMEDIPRAPSFDELDFNTRVNRTSSLSKLSGPRQLSNSALRRTFSNRSSPNKSPNKSAPTLSSSVDNSPSKKSVCFENSPPKILEYDELTPEHSDESEADDTFESKWQVNNLSNHPLPPPPPPKHIISTPSPQKETSLGSSDDSQDLNLTKEDIQINGISLEKKLDLVLNENNNDISERVQYDETFNGSSSPSKPQLSKEEQEILYSIKNKDQIARDEAIYLAHSMFEEDIRNNDRNSKSLQLDPVLKRRGSTSSLADEERLLVTKVISHQEKPIVSEDGIRNPSLKVLDYSKDDVVSQSTFDSFESATDVIEDDSIQIISDTRNVLPSKDSVNSISTLQNESKGHKKSSSLSDSIHNGLNFISSIISGNSSPIRTSPVKDLPVVTTEIDSSPIVNINKVESFPTEEAEVDATINNTESIEQDPILESVKLFNSIQVTEQKGSENKVSAEEEIEEILPEEVSEPAITLPTFEVSVTDISLIAELKNDENFSIGLNNADPSTPERSTGNDINSDNEEVVEGYRSLSPKKKVIPHPVRVVSPPTPIFDPSIIEEELEEQFANAESVIPAAETSISQETPNIIPIAEFASIPDFESQIKFEDEEIQIPQQTMSETSPVKLKQEVEEELFIESSFLPGVEFLEPVESELPVVEQIPEIKISKELQKQEETEDHIPLDEEANYENVEIKAEDEYHSLNPSIHSSPAKGPLPKFNSLLFHDKEPEEINHLKQPIDYISIWHSQPIPTSPNPQYSIHKKNPSKRVKKLLEKGLKDESDNDDDNTPFEQTVEEIFVKREPKRVEIPKDTFITRSVSKSSFINLESSRRSSLVLSQQPESSKRSSTFIKQEPDTKKFSNYYDTFETTNELSGFDLPDLDSSDFGNAFTGWDVSQVITNGADKDLLTAGVSIPDSNSNNVKSIWGTEEPPQVSTVTDINQKMIQKIIGDNSDTKFKSQKFASSEVIVGNGEGLGVDIEFDQDSQMDIYDDNDYDNEIKSQTQELKKPQTFRLVSNFEKSPIKSDYEMNIEHIDKSVLSKQSRNISGVSYGSAFDLNYEFDRIVQLQDRSYAIHENHDIIHASSNIKKEFTEDALDHHELNESNKDQENSFLRFNHHQPPKSPVPSSNDKFPLNPTNQSKLNSMILPKNRTLDSNNRKISEANSETDKIVTAEKDLNVKKRNVSQIRAVKSQQSLAPELPINDKGRLYIHLNLLRNINLEEIKNHKATFKLYLDNGKHKVSTPKYDLDSSVSIDKEFEMAIEEDITDLYVTLKVSYFKPENELVEVFERVPVNNPNRFSRIFGIKQKFKREKKFVSRKREVDIWDNQFAKDGSFGKNKIMFDINSNDIKGKTKDYSIELFNEWTVKEQSGKKYKIDPYLIGKLDVTMLYIPRTSPLESLPPSIKIAKTVANHLIEQEEIKYEGYLYQEGGDCELWKRRYFKLDGTKLIAHHETSKKPRAQINLLKVVNIIYSGKKSLKDQRNVTEEILMSDTFKLVFKNGEIINFNSETKELKDEWIKKLEKAIELNKFHQPWSRLLIENKQYV